MILGLSSLDVSISRSVQSAFERLANASQKMATLKRIQRGSDDPAGLIAAEHFSNELATIDAAVRSADRVASFTQVADSALAEAGNLLNDIHSNLVRAANSIVSPVEWEAMQYENDAALDALNRLGTTTFGGTLVFGTTVQVPAGISPTDVAMLDMPAIDDSLGGSSGTLADLRSGAADSIANGDLETALRIVDEARGQILSARAEIGAFEKYVVDSTQHVLQDMEIHLASALSSVRDADVAAEASNLVRDHILSQMSVITARALGHSRRAVAGILERQFDQSE